MVDTPVVNLTIMARMITNAAFEANRTSDLGVGSKNSNLLNDADFMTEMLADQRAARPI
jgi:hypothetical protein